MRPADLRVPGWTFRALATVAAIVTVTVGAVVGGVRIIDRLDRMELRLCRIEQAVAPQAADLSCPAPNAIRLSSGR